MSSNILEVYLYILCYLVRPNAIQTRLLSLIRPEFFNVAKMRGVVLVVRLLKECYAKTGSVPGYHTFRALVASELEDIENLNDKDEEELSLALSVVDYIYNADINISGNDLQFVQTLFDKVVTEYYQYKLQNDLSRTSYGEFERLLSSAYEEYRNTVNISTYPEANIPENLIEYFSRRNRRSTGISFLDRAMGGGTEPGEVYTVLGPTGAGKTLLGLQITYSGAIEFVSDADVNVYYTYELALPAVISRVVSMVSQIPIDRLAAIYSNPGEMYNVGDRDEFDRIGRAVTFLNRRCLFRDFSGAHVDGRIFGSGGIGEVVSDLEAITQAGRTVRTVVIDWALAMIRREIMNRSKNEDKVVSYLATMVQSLANEVARRFNCNVWILHQLSPEASKKSLKSIPDHTDAEWCKSFANYAWYSFALSKEDQNTGLQYVACTKSRRSRLVAPTVVKKTDWLAFDEVGGRYSFIPGVGITDAED